MRYLILFLLIFIQTTRAQELFDVSIHQSYMSPRAMGMGNAFVAVADNPHTLFYNPAGLSKLKEKSFEFNVMQIGSTLGEHSFLGLGDQIAEAADAPEDERTAAVTEVIQQYYGEHFTLRVTPFSFLWAKPNWAYAIIPSDLSLDAAIHRQVGPSIDVVAYHDTTLAVGHSFSLVNYPEITLGTTLKLLYRGYFAKSIPAVELARNSNFIRTDDATEGLNADLDFGILHEKEWWPGSYLALGATVRNVTNMGMIQNSHIFNSETKNVANLGRMIDVGSKLTLKRFPHLDTILTVDMRDMGQVNWTFEKGLHLGSEVSWSWNQYYRSSFRLGFNEGYLSYGMSFQVLSLLVEYASFAKEQGVAGESVENRMHLFKVALDF